MDIKDLIPEKVAGAIINLLWVEVGIAVMAISEQTYFTSYLKIHIWHTGVKVDNEKVTFSFFNWEISRKFRA